MLLAGQVLRRCSFAIVSTCGAGDLEPGSFRSSEGKHTDRRRDHPQSFRAQTLCLFVCCLPWRPADFAEVRQLRTEKRCEMNKLVAQVNKEKDECPGGRSNADELFVESWCRLGSWKGSWKFEMDRLIRFNLAGAAESCELCGKKPVERAPLILVPCCWRTGFVAPCLQPPVDSSATRILLPPRTQPRYLCTPPLSSPSLAQIQVYHLPLALTPIPSSNT